MAHYAREDSAVLLFLLPILVTAAMPVLAQVLVANNKVAYKSLEKSRVCRIDMNINTQI
jgi:hypothetical protein